MQTFFPIPHIGTTAEVLDWRRLGKQRSETKTILQVLNGMTSRWERHPAVLMWKGFETALAVYGLEICVEWRNRGYRDSLLPFFIERVNTLSKAQGFKMPWWFGLPDFHASHRAALLFKDPQHYGQFHWPEQPRIAYVWPTKILSPPPTKPS